MPVPVAWFDCRKCRHCHGRRHRCGDADQWHHLVRCAPRMMPAALGISRKTDAKTRQNLLLAFIYNLIGMSCRIWLLNPILAGAAVRCLVLAR